MSAAPGAAAIRVAVVDDQELFGYGMRMLIESQPDLAFAGSSTDGAQAVALVAETRPDVVLMDIRMPVLNGLDATRRIVGAGDSAAPRVIVLTTFQQEEAVFQAMKHGASAFVTKDATPELLLDTIRSVHAGDALPAGLAALVKRQAGAPDGAASASPTDAIASLTPREREIFLLAAKGLRNSEIAAAAFVSESTVKTHIGSILTKLGLETRAQIVVHAYENRLLTA